MCDFVKIPFFARPTRRPPVLILLTVGLFHSTQARTGLDLLRIGRSGRERNRSCRWIWTWGLPPVSARARCWWPAAGGFDIIVPHLMKPYHVSRATSSFFVFKALGRRAAVPHGSLSAFCQRVNQERLGKLFYPRTLWSEIGMARCAGPKDE